MQRLLGIAVLMLLPAMVFAQSDAQNCFDRLTLLAGSRQRTVTNPLTPEVQGNPIQVALCTTSMGNALMQEAKIAGRQDDPITLLYLDGDRLMLARYWDGGNPARLVAKTSPDREPVEFDFFDLAGSAHYGHYGHMNQGVFPFIDANHHIEDWTFLEPGASPVLAHIDLQRANAK